MKLNKIYNLNFLKNTLPDKCADLIIADPPYFEVKGDFDFIWESFEDYLNDVEKWAIECKRILADNGTLFWYGHSKKIAYSQLILDKYFNLTNNLVWNKGSFMGLEKSKGLRSFAPCTERILMYESKKETYHSEIGLINNDCSNYVEIRQWVKKEREKIPYSYLDLNKLIWGYKQNGGGIASNKLNSFKKNWQFFDEKNYSIIQDWCAKNGYNAFKKPYDLLRKEYDLLKVKYEELRRPFNNYLKLQEVLNFSNESASNRKYNHDTVKPENLTKALILTCSRENGLVVVPFAGSGTECAMSVKENRNFVGFEIEEKHVKMANERIELIKGKL